MTPIQPPKTLRIATRASALALWQARHIQQRLQELHPGLVVELLPLTTQGDRILDRPLAAVGGKGLFVKEIEQALIDGRADLAVHSIKDLPADMPEGLVLAATPERANPGDVLICRDPALRFATLPAGAIVGTSSLRRASQLLAARPDLRIIPIRGNVDTRLRKVSEGFDNLDASVLAAAGLERLGWQDRITEYLDFSVCLPAIGQGTLGIQARSDDFDTLAFLAPLHHIPSSIALTAERALLRAMQGNCHLPLAGFAQIDPQTRALTLHARLCTPDGSRVLKHIASSTLATEAAAEMLGTQTHAALMAAGGAEILSALDAPHMDPNAPKPLQNKRVIITRSRDRRSSALSARIEALGGQPIEVASIAIVPADDLGPLRDALRSLSNTNKNTNTQKPFDWIIFTSANAVEHTFQCLASEALDASALRRCMVAAVGPQTAQELAVREVRVDLHPPASDARAEQLLEALLAAGVGPGSAFDARRPKSIQYSARRFTRRRRTHRSDHRLQNHRRHRRPPTLTRNFKPITSRLFNLCKRIGCHAFFGHDPRFGRPQRLARGLYWPNHRSRSHRCWPHPPTLSPLPPPSNPWPTPSPKTRKTIH